ncbi:hypothetical protein TNCV_738841 [Trichonephila clavipes]|nr:hypothetical protein TNCV_738841 [Trichonephila clavipes]
MRSPATRCENDSSCSNGQLHGCDFLRACVLQKNATNISRLVLSASYLRALINWLLVADTVSRGCWNHPQLSELATTVPPPSQLAFMQCARRPTMDSLVRQILQELPHDAAELRQESAIPSRQPTIALATYQPGYFIRPKVQLHRLLEVKSVSSRSFSNYVNKSPQSNFSLFAADNTKIHSLRHYARPSKSPSGVLLSPLQAAPKSDSTVRPVGDYRQLNSVTELGQLYPMPYLERIPCLMHYAWQRGHFPNSRHFYRHPTNPIAECDGSSRAKSDKCSPRQIRQLDFISQSSPQIAIVHIPGSDIIAADVLSRVSASPSPGQIDYDCIAYNKQTDQESFTP